MKMIAERYILRYISIMTWPSSWEFEIVIQNNLIRESVEKCWIKETVTAFRNKVFCVTDLNFFKNKQVTLKNIL